MKNKLLLVIIILLTFFALSSCINEDRVFRVALQRSIDPVKSFEPFIKEFEIELLSQLKNQGLDFDRVEIQVGSEPGLIYDALKTGVVDFGTINIGDNIIDLISNNEPSHIKPLFLATNFAINKDFDNPKDWNNGVPIEYDTLELSPFSRNVMLAGPSEYGRFLANKINSDMRIEWEDFENAVICTIEETSVSVTVLRYDFVKLYGRDFFDLSNRMVIGNNLLRVASLANEQCDVISISENAQMLYESIWRDPESFSRPKSIYDETDIIYVGTRRLRARSLFLSNKALFTHEEARVIDALKIVLESEAAKNVFDVYNIVEYIDFESMYIEEEIEIIKFIYTENGDFN